MSTQTLDFAYTQPSLIRKTPQFSELVLSHHTEIEEIANTPCFFWGEIGNPLLTAKTLLCISKVVRSSFAPIPARLLDPIVTTGQNHIRFEGFSSCNGVYARLDLLPEGIDGDFFASGTTNVDFNEPMLNALNSVKKQDLMMLGVGAQEVQIATMQHNISEKKVQLPERWIKGLGSVQVYLAEMQEIFSMNKIQAVQFFASLPKGKSNTAMYLSFKNQRFALSPIASPNSLRIGGIERLRLLENLLPYIEQMTFFQAENGDSLAVQLYLPHMRLTLALSPDNYRGFSGEGNVLANMTQDLPLEWIYAFNGLLKSNEVFNPSLIAIEHALDFNDSKQLSTTLSAMGLLGFDLHNRQHYYRRLPFKMEKILSLNPRLKNAKKLISEEQIKIIEQKPQYIHTKVQGSGVEHTVIIQNDEAKCTCQWYAKHQNKRGLCKHILAVKMLNKN